MRVESSPWEGSWDPACGAQGVTLFQELKSVRHLFWKVFESFGSVCVHTAVCTHGCVRMRRPDRPIGGYCILGKLSGNYLSFILHSNYAASSNRASVFPVPRICRQYQSYSSYTNRVSNQIFDDVMGIWNLKKYFANSLPSLSKIKHCRPVLKFWERIHNTWKNKYVIYNTKKRNNKKENSEMLCR